ncbi:MAG TPA: MFS transporter [Kofleriaceae bacterium]|nr:MFS transporter [Kofleriaceae bacterium]
MTAATRRDPTGPTGAMKRTRRHSAWWREPTRPQWMAFLAAWLGWVLDAFDFTIYLIVVPEIAKEFGVSPTSALGSLTLTLLVRLLGSVVAGWMADRWGRKLPLMLSLVWFAVFDGLVAFAPSFLWVLVFRTLFGFGMGAEWTAGSTLAMENWPARSRGIASGILQGSWAIGFLLAALASAVVVPAWGWRGLFLVAVAPALLALPIRYLVPESAEWVEQKRLARSARTRPRTLREAGVLGKLVASCLTMGLGFGVYYGLTTSYTLMLALDHGMGPADRWPLMSIFNLGMMAGAIACGWAARRYGVKVAVALPALLMLPVLPLYVGALPSLLALGAFLGGVFGVGFAGVVPVFLTDMFPADVRARCVGIAYHVGAIMAAFVVPAIPYLHDRTGLSLGHCIGIIGGGFLALLAGLLLLAPTTDPAASRAPSAERSREQEQAA